VVTGGLVFYIRASYYEPSTGRFLPRDSVVAATREPYAYVHDDPLNAIDPSGHCPWCIGAVAGAIIGPGADMAWQCERNGGSFDNFSWGEAGPATAGGAIVGTLGAAAGWAAGGGLGTAAMSRGGPVGVAAVRLGMVGQNEPGVTDDELSRIMSYAYRTTAQIGCRSTADAVGTSR